METNNKNDQQSIGERLARIERRQVVTLQIVADIAKKEGVTNRFTDAIINLLATDAEVERRPSQERADER
jgi:predicted GNAT family acetyltransferase